MNAMIFTFKTYFIAILLAQLAVLHGAEPAVSIHEAFDTNFDATRFLTPIPNKNTEVRDGVLWTHGSSGGKYPPMVYLPVQGKDLTISFRYRHLAAGAGYGFLWMAMTASAARTICCA